MIIKVDEVPANHRNQHEPYEYYKRPLVLPGKESKYSIVSIYEIPPGKSNYPYHYHMQMEEAFYIISGSGIVKTPDGERQITAGDVLFFPTGEKGAHKLTNTSDSEPLKYIDFDASIIPLDAAFQPDSGKVILYGSGVRQIYKTDDQAEYYDGE
ncbi:MAG: cupin domain-containing protein [Oscillospiraceae bacterium]|nr:cupin domain-containing protein [Oscillospiraceae bacterium]